ncbi:MAG TPA: hypothetical protein VK459_09755 [Polyangiaceae bacterium]|jgi:hypothetical protein|nr:hypothetical protein [Polyangiaceae bacterium]
MALPRYAVHASSILALTGLLSLLLADSAEPTCAETSFDRTFDVSTTCKGESVARIRINSAVSRRGSFAPQDVQVVSGKIDIQGVDVMGSCSDEDEPFVATGMTVTVAATAADSATATGFERATCDVNFGSDLGKDVPCTSSDVPINDCTLRLTAVP